MSVTVLRRSELDERLRVEIARLWLATWPQEAVSSAEDYARQLFGEGRFDRYQIVGSDRYHLIYEAGALEAVCRTFLREIRFLESGDPMTVLGLAGVCSRIGSRGKGFGKAVVKSAFDRLGQESGCSLFQTGVPAFYEKLGARLIDNRFVNSRNESDPDTCPWWDKCVMAVGGAENWQSGRVDLLGPGY